MARVRGWRWVWGVIVVCMATAAVADAQTFTTLTGLDGKNGSYPDSLVQGADGNFYGTAEYGGANCYVNGRGNGCGTVFKVTLAGNLTRLYNFCALAQCADGVGPVGPLVQGASGKFYGTAFGGGLGGPDGCGTIFEMTTAGKLTILHSFDDTDGCGTGGLVQAANGNFYGTTRWGGVNGGGTVFEITPAGKFTSLYSFCSLSNCTDGSYVVGLVEGTDGNFYGTTMTGGANSNAELCSTGCGTIFRLTAKGALTTLYSFCSLNNCADGYNPEASLVQATNGNFYGTTYYGGANEFYGTVFEASATGRLTTLHSFCSLSNCADGISPLATLTLATDGNFYGTTYGGGATGDGTIFEITPAGELTTLHSLCSAVDCTDGSVALGVLQATNGIFYGTTAYGGTTGDGTIFSLNTGLSPFVSFIRNPAKVGQQFGILGYGLTGTTSVSLNGIATGFKTESDTLLVATVPTGATTGYVSVTTPSGTLTSNVPFRVIP